MKVEFGCQIGKCNEGRIGLRDVAIMAMAMAIMQEVGWQVWKKWSGVQTVEIVEEGCV